MGKENKLLLKAIGYKLDAIIKHLGMENDSHSKVVEHKQDKGPDKTGKKATGKKKSKKTSKP